MLSCAVQHSTYTQLLFGITLGAVCTCDMHVSAAGGRWSCGWVGTARASAGAPNYAAPPQAVV